MSARDIPALAEEPDAPEVQPDSPREALRAEGAPEHKRPDVPDDPRTPGQCKADLRQQLEGGWDPHRKYEPDRAELAKFNPERANLRPLSSEAADQYIEQHREDHPWLATAEKAAPESRRIFAALDFADGHGHIRHDGWVTEEATMRRVAYREDPAQLDPEKRLLSIDGLRANEHLHRCAEVATRITDPDAFATAFLRGSEHPKVREALETPFDPTKLPRSVRVPIADLLGPDGFRFCTGWQLDPLEGDGQAAYGSRNEWVKARSEGNPPDKPEPTASPVPTFEGGVITFMFAGNENERRYEITTLRPDPPIENRESGA